jgi:hypothetical protein
LSDSKSGTVEVRWRNANARKEQMLWTSLSRHHAQRKEEASRARLNMQRAQSRTRGLFTRFEAWHDAVRVRALTPGPEKWAAILELFAWQSGGVKTKQQFYERHEQNSNCGKAISVAAATFQKQKRRTMTVALLEGQCAGGCPTGGGGDDGDAEGQEEDGQLCRSITTDVEGARRSSITGNFTWPSATKKGPRWTASTWSQLRVTCG